MHHQVDAGQPLVNIDQPLHFERLAGRLAGEFVSAVAGADGDGQRVQTGGLDKIHRLRGIGQVAQAVETRAVPVFNAAQAADFAFHGHAFGMRRLDHLAGGLHVVLETRGRLTIRQQRAIHHDAGEAHLDSAQASLRAVTVVQMQHGRNLRIQLGGRQHQVIQKPVLRVGASAPAGLNDDRRLGLAGRLHDRLNLLHVVDVERANSVPTLGGLIEDLPQRH